VIFIPLWPVVVANPGGGGGGGVAEVVGYDGGTAGESLTFGANGIIGSAVGDLGPWVTPQQNAGAYEVRASPTGSGIVDFAGSALESWLNLGSNRTWAYRPGTTARSVTLQVSVRRASDGVILDVADFAMAIAGTGTGTGGGRGTGPSPQEPQL